MFFYDAMGKIKKEAVSKPVPDHKNKIHFPKKKKNNDKRSPDEWNRRFGFIFPQSVKCMAESVGIAGLADEVANNLAEDVSYRLRSIVQLCAKYLKHTRHKRLTCDDVNEVLRMCDVPSVLGHSSPSAPFSFVQLREPAFYLLDDPTIDLANYALNEVFVPLKPPLTVTGKWAIPDEQRTKPKIEEIKTESSDVTNHVATSLVKTEEEKVAENHKSDHLDNEPRIATDLIKYYGITCNSILGHCDLKVVLRDLSRNGKIVPIVPYLLNFITITLNKLSSERQLLRLLHAIDALTENSNIDFTPYHPVIRVCNALLKIIKSVTLDKKSSVANLNERSTQDRKIGQKAIMSYQHLLRCRAAQVLGKVFERWCCSELQRNSIVEDMAKLIRDLTLPVEVHIGAIALLNELGPDALSVGLWPVLNQLLAHLRRVARQEKGAEELELVIMNAAEILFRNPHLDERLLVDSASRLDMLLYDYFGDALCSRRLQLTENPQFLQRFLEKDSSAMDLKPEAILKRPWRLPKCKNSMYNPVAKRPTIHTAFQLPKIKRKRNPRIIFKFAGANPVPEMSLRRRRLDSRYSQFIAGKVSEGHVVLVGKLWRRLKQKPINNASLFSVI